MTNLIEKVAELMELEEKATHAPWAPGRRETGCIADDNGAVTVVLRRTNAGLPAQENIELICGLRNAAPKLLDAMGKIQAGDAEVFDALIDCLESSHGGTEYEDIELSAMRRYRDLARLMEDDHAT